MVQPAIKVMVMTLKKLRYALYITVPHYQMDMYTQKAHFASKGLQFFLLFCVPSHEPFPIYSCLPNRNERPIQIED